MDLVFGRTKKIPSKSFGLECSLCSSRHGVPIECSAQGCKAAYHTTCAIRGKLKMQAIFGKNFKGGIKLRSYCRKHSPSVDLENGLSSQADKIDANGVKEIDMTNLADDRLQEGAEELDYFWKYVDINEVHKTISEAYARSKKIESELMLVPKKESTPKKDKTNKIINDTNHSSPKKNKPKVDRTTTTPVKNEIDPLALDLIYRYWMLLRTANNGQSLIKFSPTALKEREFEQRKSIMKLRIELERVRNLSYMIGKREKLKASWLKTHQNIIKRTFNIINDISPIVSIQPKIESGSSEYSKTTNNNNNNQQQHHQPHNHNHHHNNNHHYQHKSNPMTNGKRSLHQTQHIQPTNGMFDESDQLINELITCDQIYETPHSSANNNYSTLSYHELSTMERRRTLSLVRRINRQLKNVCTNDPPLNPYAKSYLGKPPKRSDSPVGPQQQQQPTTKILKSRS